MHYISMTLPFLLLIIITIDSAAQSFKKNDYAQIVRQIENKQIIGLGEAEHFYTGYYQSKVELIKHLVTDNAIDAIALEGSISAVALLNDYIHGAPLSDLPQALNRLNEPYHLQKAGLFNCAEIAEMIDWLKAHNEKQTKKVDLIGIDFQNYSLPLNQLMPFASESQRGQLQETKNLLDSSMYTILDSGIMVVTSPEWLSRFQKAQRHVSELKTTLGNVKNEPLFRELEQFTTVWDDPMFPRDSMMYENLTKHTNTKARILIWAHNFHLEYDPLFKGPKKLGVFLKENFGPDYWFIAVSDETKKKKSKIIYPSAADIPRKYDLLLNVDKEEKCDLLVN
ncbi:MAG TPA: erythromycin esterase family protein [Candidatus Sphingobacterium stercorigallinarum]|nr:erythromycin esterase family protein [Candidatus Sphingobacterium stercorigallinarum]